MSEDNTSDAQEPDHESGVLQRLKSLLSFTKPGTKEDLDHEIQELLEEGEEHGLENSVTGSVQEVDRYVNFNPRRRGK